MDGRHEHYYLTNWVSVNDHLSGKDLRPRMRPESCQLLLNMVIVDRGSLERTVSIEQESLDWPESFKIIFNEQ